MSGAFESLLRTIRFMARGAVVNAASPTFGRVKIQSAIFRSGRS